MRRMANSEWRMAELLKSKSKSKSVSKSNIWIGGRTYEG